MAESGTKPALRSVALRKGPGGTMFYNYSLAGYFILAFVAFWATLKGLETLKTRTFAVPFGDERRPIEGPGAMRAGVALLALGAISLLGLVVALIL